MSMTDSSSVVDLLSGHLYCVFMITGNCVQTSMNILVVGL